MLTDEFLADSSRWTKVDRDLNDQETVITTMLQYLLNLLVGQASLVIRDHGDLPGLQPRLQSLVLPKDLRVIGEALIMAIAGIRRRRCLAANEAIAHDLVALQMWGPSPSRCP